METNQFFKRIPLWAWIIIVIFLIGLISSSLPENIETKIKQEEEIKKKQTAIKKIQAKEFHDKGEKLNNEVGEVFLQSKYDIFTKSHLENIGNSAISLELTVKDSWYYLPKFQQDRLIEDAWRIFNMLAVKYKLRNENDIAWEVIFLDTYEKKVAKMGW